MLVGAATALTVALVALVLALPFVRSVARDQARDQLARAVETLAARPQLTSRILAQEETVVGPDDRTFSVLTRDGRLVGGGAAVLDASDLQRLSRAGRLSTERSVDGQDVLVEARSTRRSVVVVGLQPVAGVDAVDRAFVRRLAVALVAGLALSLVLAAYVARRLARPVAETAAAAHRMASGERGVDLPEATVVELAEMTTALRSLDAALLASEGRQREFLLSVSHEIRTPLTALRGYAEALRDGTIEGTEVRDAGAVLASQTERLDRFVADLLALARLEADDFALAPEQVALLPLLGALLDAWAPVAARSGVTLLLHGDPMTVTVDPQRLRQVIEGLVENAVRVSPGGTTVTVRVEQSDAAWLVRVEDEGPGLAEGEHARAFERGFLRDQHSGDRAVGTGLGLSIAQRLAGRMGATLAASPAASGGTVMELRFPLTP